MTEGLRRRLGETLKNEQTALGSTPSQRWRRD